MLVSFLCCRFCLSHIQESPAVSDQSGLDVLHYMRLDLPRPLWHHSHSHKVHAVASLERRLAHHPQPKANLSTDKSEDAQLPHRLPALLPPAQRHPAHDAVQPQAESPSGPRHLCGLIPASTGAINCLLVSPSSPAVLILVRWSDCSSVALPPTSSAIDGLSSPP